MTAAGAGQARLLLFLILFGTGAVWGLTIPLAKIAVSTGHGPIGLIAAEMIIGATLLALLLGATGGLFRLTPARITLCAIVALSGSIIPNFFSFVALSALPGGVIAITTAMVPIFAMPIALAFGHETLSAPRMLGIGLGALAVILLVGPEASLPEPGLSGFVLIALLAPLCYGFEGNFVAWRGTSGLAPMQILLGAMGLGLVAMVPMAWATGQWIDPRRVWGPPEFAIVVMTLLHIGAYATYLWLVGRAGPVFSAQVAYIVTGTGVLWSMLILSESYSGWIWAALALILLAVALVQPRNAGA